MDTHFRLLGPLEVLTGDQPVHIGGARQRVVLAMLLLEAGRVVATDRLIDAVWGNDPPATARSQVQIAVSELRRRLGAGGDRLIATHPVGYLARVDEGSLDLLRFRSLVASGRAAVGRGDPAAGLADLRAALHLWRGEVAAGITSRIVQAAGLRLAEERLAAIEECIGLELALGRHQSVIGELQEMLTVYPSKERLHAHLMLALYRAGRQAEALAAYRQAQDLLVNEYGLDPGEELRALERAILTNDPALDLPTPAPAAVRDRIVPRQLPAAVADFVGREAVVTRLRQTLTTAGGAGRVEVVVAVVTGAAGVGKTALALHTAHNVREHFPDGQLFAHLRGSDVHPTRPEHVLDQFLRALGVAPDLLPTELAELAALYRSRLAGQRMLVVVDDVANADQVEPLLPGDPQCALLATSRSGLPGLPGGHRFDVEVFTEASSLAMLSRVLGEDRVRAEPEAAVQLADVCGHLPLALRIAAAKLAVRPHWRIAAMVRRLSDERRRLDELTLEGVGVRASISLSYNGLTAAGKNLLLALSTLGAGDFGGWVAAPLLDAPAPDAADTLDELVTARLVDAYVDVHGQARYRLHDLIGVFAREALATEVPAAARADAQHRLLRCWLFLVRQAHARHYGGAFTVLRSEAEPWPLPEETVADLIADPIRWFDTEHANLAYAVSLADQLSHDELCWELAMAAVTLFESRGDRDAWRETHEVALRAVRRAGNHRGEAAMRYSRGGLGLLEQRLPDAREDLTAALSYFETSGDTHGRGLALRNLAFADRIEGQYETAVHRYTEALSDLRAVGDRGAEAHVLGNLAQIHLDREHYQEAERLLRDALAICAEITAARLEAQLRYRLGQLHLEQRQLAPAEAAFSDALAATTEVADRVGRGYALLGLGSVRLARGDAASARHSLCEALEAMRFTGHRLGIGQALLVMAEVAIASQDPKSAETCLGEAESLFSEIGASLWCTRASELRAQL